MLQVTERRESDELEFAEKLEKELKGLREKRRNVCKKQRLFDASESLEFESSDLLAEKNVGCP